MTLIKCSECGKRISNYAVNCPKCGILRKPWKKYLSIILTIIIPLFAVYVGFQLEWSRRDRVSRDNTFSKLNTLYLETTFNNAIAKEKYHTYAILNKANKYFLNDKILSSFAAETILQDKNIFNVLNINQIEIIMGSIATINLINTSERKLRGYFNLNENLKNKRTISSCLSHISSNTIHLLAMNRMLQTMLKDVLGSRIRKSTDSENINKEIDTLKLVIKNNLNRN